MLTFVRFGSVMAALATGFALVGTFGGCSSGPTGCDPTQCLKGNQCITGWQTYDEALKSDPMTKTTQCRLTCNAQTDCPFNYHCIPGGMDEGGTVAYCVQDRIPYVPTAQGESAAGAPWGAPCDPTKGLVENTDCNTVPGGSDDSQQFWCYGTAPTDANAFCTQYQTCTDEGDCPGGWWCATINDSPDVRSSKRTDWGTGTTTLCLPRTYDLKPGSYCAPCKTDLDCPLNDSIAQHCVSADNNGGTELACAVECTTDSNCPLDYQCAASAQVSSSNVCVPRAATCLGNNTFCSPCHSDADCSAVNGYCIIGDYSTEHYCTTKSGETCSVNNNMLVAQCPSTTGTPTNAGVSCSYSGLFLFPQNQCYGLVNFGAPPNNAMVGGCWTKH